MTRKDYIVIASALRDAYQKEEMNNKHAVLCWFSRKWREGAFR